jgi:hypothetical protein
VGIEMQRLFSLNRMEQRKERIDQLLHVSERATQFFAYVLLSQLWAESKTRLIQLSPDFHGQFRLLDRPSFGCFAGLLRAIQSIFEDNGIVPFTHYMDSASFSKKKFFAGLDELIQIRNRTMHQHLEPDYERLEVLATELLCHISFFVKYKLVGISEIEVVKPRLTNLTDAKYKHSMRILNSQRNKFATEDHEYGEFCDSHSVLLLKDFRSPKEYLNLSPFVIDTNWIKKDYILTDIKEGIYLYTDVNNGKYMYYFTDGSEQAAFNSLPIFQRIRQEFLDVKKCLAEENQNENNTDEQPV